MLDIRQFQLTFTILCVILFQFKKNNNNVITYSCLFKYNEAKANPRLYISFSVDHLASIVKMLRNKVNQSAMLLLHLMYVIVKTERMKKDILRFAFVYQYIRNVLNI